MSNGTDKTNDDLANKVTELKSRMAEPQPIPEPRPEDLEMDIPDELLVKNRQPLTPEQQAKADLREWRDNYCRRTIKDTNKASRKAAKAVKKAKTEARTPAEATGKATGAKKPAKGRAAKDRAKNAPSGPRKGTKTAIILKLLRRSKGCTRADILQATGWPSVSVQAVARQAGIKLLTEEGNGCLRYHAA